MTTTETPTIRVPASRPPRHGVRTAMASLAAIGSIIAASSCCLPLLPLLLAAGSAGAAAFLAANRPYFIGAAVLFVGFAFHQAWRAKRCRRPTGVINTYLLFTSAAFVLIAIFFPQVMANTVANLLAR